MHLIQKACLDRFKNTWFSILKQEWHAWSNGNQDQRGDSGSRMQQIDVWSGLLIAYELVASERLARTILGWDWLRHPFRDLLIRIHIILCSLMLLSPSTPKQSVNHSIELLIPRVQVLSLNFLGVEIDKWFLEAVVSRHSQCTNSFIFSSIGTRLGHLDWHILETQIYASISGIGLRLRLGDVVERIWDAILWESRICNHGKSLICGTLNQSIIISFALLFFNWFLFTHDMVLVFENLWNFHMKGTHLFGVLLVGHFRVTLLSVGQMVLSLAIFEKIKILNSQRSLCIWQGRCVLVDLSIQEIHLNN